MLSQEVLASATEFGTLLGETGEDPLRQIQLLIHHLGLDYVRGKVEETLRLEEQGGLMTQDGTRRRTPGGVFFYLIKGAMNPDVRQEVFPNFGQGRKRPGTIEWDKRMDYLAPLLEQERGKATQIRVALQGRPGSIHIEEGTVLMVFEHHHEAQPTDPDKAGLPQLPRGVPAPPEGKTLYTVYVGINQWERVQKPLENPRDLLMIDGVLFYDEAVKGIAVFAVGVTTRELERRQKRAEKMARQVADQKAAAAARAQKRAAAAAVAPRAAAPEDAAAAPVPAAPAAPPVIPQGAPAPVADQLQKLYAAADTLRERIATKLAAGQKPSLEQKLLQNTEKQIDALKRQSS
ncbi:MAG: phosphorylated adapter RNA export RNA-binding domain-containing protein [Anaerolineae bacterium]|nr:phosphorylated adapter RNA export RNA-binding domain-containing protein [Anaerolineae bacterium]